MTPKGTNDQWIFFSKHKTSYIHSIFNVAFHQLSLSTGNNRSYFSKWNFEHLEKALFWIKRGKSLPLRQTRFRTSATWLTSSFQQTVFTPLRRMEAFWAIKEAKQKPVIKASCPARCPLNRSSMCEDLEGDNTVSLAVTWTASSISMRATLLSSFLFRFLAFFWSSNKIARNTSWDFLQFDSLLQKPWFCKHTWNN